jgi:hypothetical protein
MAKRPNYNFEKRQKELAKKAKKEEKKQRKLLGLPRKMKEPTSLAKRKRLKSPPNRRDGL